jgi:hypothetical protein
MVRTIRFALLFCMSANTAITELSIAPSLNNQLVPAHVRPALEAQGLDIDNFKPLTKDEMMARLD